MPADEYLKSYCDRFRACWALNAHFRYMKAFVSHFLIEFVGNCLVVYHVHNGADKEEARRKKIKHPHCYLAHHKTVYPRYTTKAK